MAMQSIKAPKYDGSQVDIRQRVLLAVESMKDHMTDEGNQLQLGLKEAGYVLVGFGFPHPTTDVKRIIRNLSPGVVIVQDKREWLGLTADRSRDPRMRFTNTEVLRETHSIFKVTVLKDAQNDHDLHRGAAEEMSVHAWIVYYHPDMVCRVAPYVRKEHLVRTYHTIDSQLVPPFSQEGREGCILSGALNSKVYPLRHRLHQALSVGRLSGTAWHPHPGYHRRGCESGGYLKTLSKFKVAVCTASAYGYALRKIIEATAAGCAVITDLPETDELPYIDDNLTRVSNTASVKLVADTIARLMAEYDPGRQEFFANVARSWYDYRSEGVRLANAIDSLRYRYNSTI